MYNINYKEYKPVINMTEFVELLLASLASNTKIHYFSKKNIKTLQLPFDYKNRIEKIMDKNNEDFLKFSKIINLEEYYDNQYFFENILGEQIKVTLSKLEKKVTINWQDDTLCADYTEEEIESIKSRYDKEIVELMDYFTSLLSNYTFSREYVNNFEKIERTKDIQSRQTRFFTKVLKRKQNENYINK